MKFGLSTLLPKLFSERWIQFMSVIDSVLGDLKDELVSPILNQHDITKATNDQIINAIKYFGYVPSYLDGFSSTTEYLTREYVTITDRIKKRNTKESYELVLNIFFQKGTVYPMFYDYVQDIYLPYLTWWDFSESTKTVNSLDPDKNNLLYYINTELDNGTTFDSNTHFDYAIAVFGSPKKTGLPEAFLDTPELIESLDQFHNIENMTRYIYVQMVCRKMLTDDSFLDFNAMTSLLYDLNDLHRPTEVLYFFPKVFLYTKNDNTETNIEIEKYDKTITKEIKSIMLSGTLEDVQTISYGTGYSQDLTGITSLVNLTQPFNLNHMYIKEKVPNTLHFFTTITANIKAFSFSEIGLYNIYNELIYYACFPSIMFPDNINGGNEIYIKLDTETNINNFYATL